MKEQARLYFSFSCRYRQSLFSFLPTHGYTDLAMPTLAVNKSVGFSFEIQEKFEAGIALSGPEVKAAKQGNISLKGSYITIRPDGAWLIGCYISPYKPAQATQQSYAPTRDRHLLLRQSELSRLVGAASAKGLTVLPISFYTKGGLIKVEVAIAKGKKKADKRESIKKRDIERRIRQSVHH